MISRVPPIMFLYPLWIILVGACCTYCVGKATRNRLAVRLTASAFVVSSIVILISYSSFTKPVRLGLAGTFVAWELNPLTIFAAMVMGLMVIPFLIYWAPSDRNQGDYHPVLTLALLALYSAMGTAMAANPFLFMTFFEMAIICIFVMANLEKKRFGTSGPDYLFYFLPSFFLVVLAGMTLLGSRSPVYNGVMVLMAVLVPVIFFVRFCLFLTFFSMPRVLGTGNVLSAPLGLSLVLVAGACAWSRFFGGKPGSAGVMIAFTVLSMVAAAYVFTRKNLRGLVVQSYVAQTASVLSLLFLAGWSRGFAKGDVLLVLVNHVISGLGMFLCLSGDEGRDRLSDIGLIVFMGLLSGLVPSVGLIGRVNFFAQAYTLDGGLEIVALVLFLTYLLLLLCYLKAVRLVTEGWGGSRVAPMPLEKKASIAILLVYSFAPLFFYGSVVRYFSTLGRFLTPGP
ncbi:MAG: hypothetical protein A4E58_01454 [Syntrophorhabdus sp. PtaB.Bin006]|nr:MAG: hypothetical protein A4E58_01454 [Syntrophorhabdus sp. PtaB.Bin006]